jgi:imidazolonepropionase-like amidohydrolase
MMFTTRVFHSLKLGSLFVAAVIALLTPPLSGDVLAQVAPPAPQDVVLFQNVRIFDGKGSALSAPSNVLVRGNKIERISTAPIPTDRSANTRIVEGGGRTLMPGLSDMHAHLTFWTLPFMFAATADYGYLQIRQAVGAHEMLMAGFTSVRDVSGPVFGIKRAIDEGLVPGPRIWPSGPMISQTSGHSDFRSVGDLPSAGNPGVITAIRFGFTAVADGVPEVHKSVRENLMRGASQIKLAVGGGVSSNFDPIDVTEYTRAEIEAAVADADNWGTYVAAHAYTPKAVRLAVEAGVKSIEHGQLLDEPTIRLLAERGIWLSLQPFLEDEDAIPTTPGSENEAKYKQVAEGTDRAYRLAKRHGVKVAFGTDIQFNPDGAAQSFYLPKLVRWYAPAEVLKMATGTNGELLALSGPRNPYPGKLGVAEEGALADLLLIDGDPIVNIKLLEDPGKYILVIMKDGKIYKDMVSR